MKTLRQTPLDPDSTRPLHFCRLIDITTLLLTGFAIALPAHALDLLADPTRRNANVTMVTQPPTMNVPAPTNRFLVSHGRIPLHFEANHGQSDPSVELLARGQGYSLFLTPTEAVLKLSSTQRHEKRRAREEADRGCSELSAPAASDEQKPKTAISVPKSATVRMSLRNANSHSTVSGLDELPGKVNYFKGNHPAKWRTNVTTFAKVKYAQVYPGIDLVLYSSSEHQLEYEFAVAPGTAPSLLRVVYEGADMIQTDSEGNLALFAASEKILLHKLRLQQMKESRIEEVVGTYVRRQHRH